MKKFAYVFLIVIGLAGLLFSFGFFSEKKTKEDPTDLIQVEKAMRNNAYINREINEMMLYNKIEIWKKIYPEYDKLKFAKISEMKKAVDDADWLLADLKGQLIGAADNITSFVGDTLRYSLVKNPWSTDAANKILLDVPEKSQFSATMLKEKLVKALNLMKAADSTGDYQFQSLNVQLNDIYTSDGHEKKWEEASFRDRPLINVQLTLTSLSMELQQTERLTLEIFIEQNKIQ
jgi:hypothetical protein